MATYTAPNETLTTEVLYESMSASVLVGNSTPIIVPSGGIPLNVEFALRVRRADLSMSFQTNYAAGSAPGGADYASINGVFVSVTNFSATWVPTQINFFSTPSAGAQIYGSALINLPSAKL